MQTSSIENTHVVYYSILENTTIGMNPGGLARTAAKLTIRASAQSLYTWSCVVSLNALINTGLNFPFSPSGVQT